MWSKALLLVLFVGLSGCKWSGDSADPPANPPVTPPAAVAPTITAQPASLGVSVGQPATFSVVATGTGPLTYQWRRDGADIAGATGATYTAASVAMTDDGATYSVVVTNGVGSVTSGAAVLTVSLPAGTTASIEIDRTTALLKGAGETARIDARPVDAQGAPLAGAVTWTSSNPAAVTVDGTGRITAQTIGSALLHAEANGVRSQPVFVLVAEPMPGALILDDQQIVSVGNADANSRYDVTVSGVANAPAPGTVVIASGDATVAGKVVVTRPEAGNLVLTLELVPLPQLLARYDIDWEVDLSTLPVEKIRVTAPLELSSGPQKVQALARDGGFQNFVCEGEFTAALVSPTISLTPRLNARLVVVTSRDDASQLPDYAKTALVGTAELQGTAGIKLSAEFGAKVDCIAQARLRVPVGGLVSLIIMPALRFGVGFELEGKLVAVTAELTATGKMGLQQTLGFECTNGNCRPLEDITLIDDFKFTKDVPSVNDMHAELSGQLYVLAGIDAIALLGLADVPIVQAKYGPKQTFDLAFEDDQAKNGGTASNYQLNLDGAIEPGAALADAIEKFLGEEVSVNFKIPFSTPLAASPKGTLSLSSNNISFGSPVAFQVHLNEPLTYPLVGADGQTAYNVDKVKLYRRKSTEADFTVWQPITGSNGQSTFQYEWTPTSSDMGDWEIAAFVETLMPVPDLEVAEDSVQHLHVRGPGWSGNVTLTMRGNEVTTVNDSDSAGNYLTVTTYSDNASATYQLETLPGAEGTPILKVANASGTYSKSIVEQWDANYRSNGCDVVATQTREEAQTGNLRALEGSIAVISFNQDGTYEILIPNLTADTSGTLRVAASEQRSGHESCRAAPPTNTTSTVNGVSTTAILSLTGTTGQNPRSLIGTMTVPVPGLPDHEYSVTWNLQQ
jgi:hypothetical protein